MVTPLSPITVRYAQVANTSNTLKHDTSGEDQHLKTRELNPLPVEAVSSHNEILYHLL